MQLSVTEDVSVEAGDIYNHKHTIMKIVQLTLDEDAILAGIDAIALVQEPAIEEDFYAFSKMNFESYDDYPQAASDNAARAVRYAEKNG